MMVSVFLLGQKPYQVEKLSDEDGFPNSAPLGIGFQDDMGMIWFPMRGALLRYDGYEVKTYGYQEIFCC